MNKPHVSLLQSIADKRHTNETFDAFPACDEKVKKTLRLLKLFGDLTVSEKNDDNGTVQSYLIRKDVRVNGEPAADFLSDLTKGKNVKHHNPSANPDFTFHTGKQDGEYVLEGPRSERRYVKLRLELEKEDDLQQLFATVVKYAPTDCFVELQPDSHSCGGGIFVGMVMTYDHNRIPIALVSADIGCGLAMLPVVKGDQQVNVESIDDMEDFKIEFLCKTRSSIRRGKVVERGEVVNETIYEALEFYGDEDDIGKWLDDFVTVLKGIGMWHEVLNLYEKKERTTNLTHDQDACLVYLSRYIQTLGSSGNHFYELSVDDRGFLWSVVHSGSRRIGAMVYSAISAACKALNDGLDVATGEMCDFYRLAYDVLNKFARLNRAMCAMAVMKNNGFVHDGRKLAQACGRSWIFVSAGGTHVELLKGLTHNGIKAFVEEESKKVVYILNKGSIAVSRKLSSSIVALKAGEGCVVYVLRDDQCTWKEVTMEESHKRLSDEGYSIASSSSSSTWREQILFAGHGAGRKQSTTATEQQFQFKDLVEYMRVHGVAANIAPGVLGDHPDGYKDAAEIMATLPLDIAVTSSQLKTLVSYKEGLPKGPNSCKRLAGYLKKEWENMDVHTKKCMDLNLVKGHVSKEFFDIMQNDVN